MKVTITIDSANPAETTWLDAPDGPGWWAFAGGKWVLKPIYDPCERDEDDRPIINAYEMVVGEPFEIVLLVRYSKTGERVDFVRHSAPYHGEPILGFLPTHSSWNTSLQSLDTVCGKWQRLHIAWPSEVES